jgi:alkaline phosphatase
MGWVHARSWLALVLVACAPTTTLVEDASRGDASRGDGSIDASRVDGSMDVDASRIDASSGDASLDARAPTDAGPRPSPPRVILMIGDGMGRGQLEAASLFAHGTRGALRMQSLPVRGELTTGGPSGIVDSAASATAMSSGEVTYNARVAIDRDGAPLETLVELAHAHGLATGIVTTAALPHATPAAFSAHHVSRHAYVEIATEQARSVQPHVMLGGGARYFRPAGAGSARSDEGVFDALASAGYLLVDDADALATATSGRVFGAFADEHLTYVRERRDTTREPTLSEMSLAALRVLDAHPEGFFLMIEGARIDMASHGNDLANAVAETLAFDEAVEAVRAWALARGDVTLMVTADHECGGLEVVRSNGPGVLPDVTWRWGNHTNARVDVFAEGPGTEVLHGAVRDHRWIHAVAKSRLTGSGLVAPPRVAIPDGRLTDLRHAVVMQANESGFGAGYNRLDALRLDADRHGLVVGVGGLMRWGENAIVVLIDVDPGDGTGHAGLAGALSDRSGIADAILTASRLTAPPVTGFGADLAVVSFGGADPQIGELRTEGGLRGLRAPFGRVDDLGWWPASLNFGEGVRVRTESTPVPDEGFEVLVPWTSVFPELGGRVPSGSEVAIAVVLVNGDGGFTSNQALPPFAPGTANPGRTLTPLPGVVRYVVDGDGDGVADGDRAPFVVP